MALNKRKILDAAQKYLQKGSLDRALKEYEKVLDADPKDTNVRLKVGDVQLRLGRSAEAISAYLDVAKEFMKKGFDAKAVALYKQIIKIDEKRYDVYEPLAELYQRLGLLSEAMGALQTAAEAYQREGRKKDGLALLRKMASLDPTNTTTRLKVAEMLWTAELANDALAEYDEVAAELGRQGDHEGIVRVHEQVLRHQPERLENLVGLGTAQLEMNRPEAAEVPLLKATEVAVESVEAWEALARVHEAMGRRKDMEDAWKTVAAIHKDRGNEDRAKEILQLYVTPEGIGDAGGLGGPELDTGDSPLNGDDTLTALGDSLDAELGGASLPPVEAIEPEPEPEPEIRAEPEPALDTEDVALEADEEDEIDIELDEEVASPELDASMPPAEASPEEDDDAEPTQLLAEAGVYLRYSQHDKAIECLERVLSAEPGHLEALEKLGEAQLAMEDAGAAVEAWKEAAGHALSARDEAAFERLCERIRSVDEDAAEALAADALTPAFESSVESGGEELDFELAFDTPSGEPELTGAAEASPLDLEDLLDDAPLEASDEDPVGASDDDTPDSEAELAEREPAATEESDDEFEFSVPASGVKLDAPSGSAEIPAEDLEEAEFYYKQGLYDEAEQILRRLLAEAPGHPQVLLRLGEIAKLRGESPSAPVSEGIDFDRTADDTDPGVLAEDTDATLDDLHDAAPSPTQKAAEPPAAPVAVADPDDAVADSDDAVADPDDAVHDIDDAPVVPIDVVEDDGDEEGFDLAAELSDVLDDDSGGVGSDDSIGNTTQAGFQSVFQSFKQGVQEALGEGEYETHYDLGIAYREMGLLEDAAREFGIALASPERKLDCLGLMGLCALDLGRIDDAVSHFEQALALPELPDDRLAGLRFDLGRAFEQKGEHARARELWEQVLAFDDEFPEAAERLARLGRCDSSPSLGNLEVEAPDAEPLESFDDLIAEAESGFDADDDDDDPDDDPGGTTGSQWGRKVSYG